MPGKWFICPDGEKIEINKCLSPGGCRLKDPCCPSAILNEVAYEREWRGVTASMAGIGVREIYLKATKDYAYTPDSRMYSILGTKVHRKLAEEKNNDNSFKEVKFDEGTSDVLEQDYYYEPGSYILYDYKTWGSYPTKKAIGIWVAQDKRPMVDVDGNPVLYKVNTKYGKVGEQRMETVYIPTIDQEQADVWDVSLQCNRYRIAWEDRGFKISRMFVFAIVRDGDCQLAFSRGIMNRSYKINIPFIANETVLEYYKELEGFLKDAFRTGWVPMCNEKERWNGKKCEKHCDVVEACKKMSLERGEKPCVVNQ